MSENADRFRGLQSCAGYVRLELVCVGFDGYNQPNQNHRDKLNLAGAL